MKTIIAGSRHIIDYGELVTAIIASGFDITEVVCGCAKGADELGLIWGTNNDVPVKRIEPEWDKYGRSAGPKRNVRMAKYAANEGALIALWDGESRGTAHMIKVAKMHGLKVYVHLVEKK